MEQNITHAYLVQMNEPHAGRQVPLDQDLITLGRASSNHLAFPGDDSISRQHARIANRLGLLWLEDLGSTNGTFFTPSAGEERQLVPNESVLLLEDSRFRLGILVSFQVKGATVSQDEATRLLRLRLHQMLLNMYQNLSQFSPAQQHEQFKAIRSLEERMRAARDEEELAMLAAQGIQNLNESMLKTARFHQPAVDMPADEAHNLPPLPNDLPDPGDPRRLRTILNAFITDIRICFPANNHQNEQDQ
jgi:hypothetical protein